MFERWCSHTLARKVKQPFMHLLFGAQQTGKSTLLGSLLPADAVHIDLADPSQRVAISPQPLCRRCAPPAIPQGDGISVTHPTLDCRRNQTGISGGNVSG